MFVPILLQALARFLAVSEFIIPVYSHFSKTIDLPYQKNIYDYGGGKNESYFDLQFCFHDADCVSGFYKVK